MTYEFAAPFIVLALGLALAGLTRWEGKRLDRQLAEAEEKKRRRR
jgi:hypothetical protein